MNTFYFFNVFLEDLYSTFCYDFIMNILNFKKTLFKAFFRSFYKGVQKLKENKMIIFNLLRKNII